MPQKKRLDLLLLEKNLVPSREKAKSLIMAGDVFVNDQKITKAGSLFPESVEIRINQKEHNFVSRGGLKLNHALKEFCYDARNKVAIDVGASTGGFTDCLLQSGATLVFAIDVGYGQLDWSLRSNQKVVTIERENFRSLPFERIGTFVDLVVIDASFISLEKLLPNSHLFLKKGGDLIALVKPQFEVGKENVSKGGVVKEQNQRIFAIEKIKAFAEKTGFISIDQTSSPILGKKKGNEEFLLLLRKI